MNNYPKKHLIAPKSGPQPQGLNIQYNTVKTIPSEKINGRSEERRVGKECRSRWSPYH